MGLKLLAEVGLDGSGFERGLHRIGHAAEHNLKSLVAGAFGVYTIHEAIHKTVESAEELVTASKRLDITVERLQVLRQAAKESGVEFGNLEKAIEKINVAREKALGGDAKKMAAFARLGVSPEDLRNLSGAAILSGPMGEKIRNTNAQDLAKPGADIFGMRGFGELIPLLKTDFEELEGKMQHLGSIMSTEAAVQVKLLAEEFGLLSNILVAQLAPGFMGLAKVLIWCIGQVQAFGGFWSAFVLNLVPAFQNSKELNPMRRVTGAISASLTAGANQRDEELKRNRELRGDLDEQVKKLADRIKNPPKPEVDTAEKAAKTKSVRGNLGPSDALLSVGNFLGSGSRLINTIAEQQLAVARDQLNETKLGNRTLDKIAERVASNMSADDFDVP